MEQQFFNSWKVDRKSRDVKSMKYLDFVTYEKNFRAKREARKYKDDLISKSFYRFGYQHKICNVLNHTLKTHGKIARDEFVNEVHFIPNNFVTC